MHKDTKRPLRPRARGKKSFCTKRTASTVLFPALYVMTDVA